jgi:uncharacterized membrane protein YgcG
MKLMRASFAKLAAVVVLLAASASRAQVADNAGILSEQGKRDIESRIAAVRSKTGRQVRVETYPQIPAEQRAAFDAASNKSQFYDEWTHARGAATQADVLLLLNMNPGHAEIGEAERIRTANMFALRDRRHVLDDVLVPALKSKDYDRGVAQAVDAIGAALQRNVSGSNAASSGVPARSNPAPSPTPSSTPPTTPAGRSSGGGLLCGGGGMHMGWLCLAAGVIIVLVLVRGLRRVMGGGRANPPPGYGQPGYGQPGYGQPTGGGGGFGRGMLGGLLGGMLGGAAYDHFSHRGGQAGAAPPPAGAGPLQPDTGLAPGPDDFTSSSGADFDAGGGGGADFGGGGGGDSGSSGADF